MSAKSPEKAEIAPNDTPADGSAPTETKGTSQKAKKSVLFLEDDDFYKKWAGPLILGPFPLAAVSLFVIVAGELLLYTYQGSCSYPIDGKNCEFVFAVLFVFILYPFIIVVFVSAAIGVCYLFLIVYSWVFIGDTVKIQIQFFKMDRVILWPFKSMKWLMMFYLVIGFTSFIVWCVGSSLLNMAYFCAVTSPSLYNFTTFLVAVYWIAFIIVILYIVKLTYGGNIWAIVQAQFKQPTVDEMEEIIFRKKFAEHDKFKEGKIPRESLPPLLQSLGVYVPDEEIPALLKTLDPSDSGMILFDEMFKWFKKLNSLLAEHEKDTNEIGNEEKG